MAGKPKPKGNTIIVHHDTGGGSTTAPPKGTQTQDKTPTGSGSGGGAGGYSSYLAQQKKAQRAANRRYLDLAATIGQQAKAWRFTLGAKGFQSRLNQRLANANLVWQQNDQLLQSEYGKQVKSLAGAAKDNEKSAEDQSYLNLANKGRERSQAMQEAINQGAGESDLLRSQEASLRNWNANQADINRSYFDTLRSINSSLTDLTGQTRTARVNAAVDRNADLDAAYTNYYDSRSEAYTQLGNVLGQQAEYYGLANEQVGSKKTQKRRRRAAAASNAAFQNAATLSGKAYKNPGVEPGIMQWKGADQFEGMMNQTNLGSAQSTIRTQRPEGASLRKWEQ